MQALPTVGEHRFRTIESLTAMGTRINALAAMLGVPLNNADDYTRILRHDDQAVGASAPKRGSGLHAELRGLIVMRYTIVGRCVDQQGDQVARDLLDCARVLLKGRGPSGLGRSMDLRPLFDDF